MARIDEPSGDIPRVAVEDGQPLVGREWLIRRIEDWFSRADAAPAFLLTAPPGWGKTTLARMLADSRADVVYAHFCRASDPSTLDPMGFIERLSVALAAADPAYAAALSPDVPNVRVDVDVEQAEPGAKIIGVEIGELRIEGMSALTAFDRIIRGPIEKAAKQAGRAARASVVVDGLDEALYRSDETILDVLNRGWGEGVDPPHGLRLIATVRPASDALEVLRFSAVEAVSLNGESASEQGDLRAYVQARTAKTELPTDFIESIIASSGGSFLYARMVLDEVESGRASVDDVARLSSGGVSEYLRSFMSKVVASPEQWQDELRPIVGAIAIADARGLDDDELSQLTSLPRDRVARSLERLRPLLLVDSERRYHLYHSAIRDFFFADPDFFVYPSRLRRSFRRFPGLAPLVAAPLVLPDEPPGGGTLAGYVSDAVPRGAALRDQLRMQSDVNALCSVMVARDVLPPLSIGLFGEWGTGKSFFMQLMKQRIRAIDARVREQPDAATAFCSNVKQIEFNAWHYADANLWASLAMHIFEGLAENDAQRGKLISSLATTEQQRDEAKERLRAAEARRYRAENRLREIEAMRDRPGKVPAAMMLRAVGEGLTDQELADAANDLTQALGREVDAGSVVAEAQALKRLPGQLRYVWGLLQGLARKRVILATGLFVMLLTVAVVVGTAAGAWKGLIALSASVLVAVAEFAKDLREPIGRVQRAATIATEAAQRVDMTIADAVREARQERDHASREYVLAKQELEDLSAGRRLYKFVEERLASEDYRSHLGVVAHIRRDFERLAQLLQGQVTDGANGNDQDRDLPLIERVILYIDDLDRCRASRVVEVLEAVHLLLAFELFVVVVGVDSRWLLSSLSQRYRTHIVETADDARGGPAEWSATPQNYLEKIFQIPFVLRPMDEDGFDQLVRSMITIEDEARASDRSQGGDDHSATAPREHEASEAAAEPTPTRTDGDGSARSGANDTDPLHDTDSLAAIDLIQRG